MPGWYLPGGGVEPGESLGEALTREIAEEAGAALTGPARLFGVYRNANAHARDHVALFVCRDWETPARPKSRISRSSAWSSSRSTRCRPIDQPPPSARIEEVLRGATPAADW